MKKVILILIDSLMARDLENIIALGKAPALKFLYDNGIYQSECVTSFPTMTASVDASLMMGVYPNEHRVPGLVWYKPDERRLVDYVNGTKTVRKLGISQTAKDVLINLNEKHLSRKVKTIFEDLTDNGLTAGSINFIIHRGKIKHQLELPLLLNLLTKFSLNKKNINGPEILSIGALHKPRKNNRKIPWGFDQSFFKGYGINDNFAIEVAKFVITSGSQPDFMAIYLPDHDHYLHKNIKHPLISLEKIDKKLAKFLNIFDSWENALKQNTFIILGDHGQTTIGQDQEHNIDLDKAFAKFKVVNVGKKATSNDDVIIANNERMAYIYPLNSEKKEEIKEVLLQDKRIDFIAWKDKNQIIVEKYNNHKLIFNKNGQLKDIYNVSWSVHGDLEILDLSITDNVISFNDYPDALSRLYGAINSQDIDMFVISANPSYEFISETFPTHLGGGSHGSLHKIDSSIPILISGATKNLDSNFRIIDLKDYILQLLNINSVTTG